MDVVEKIAKMSKGGRKVPAGGPPVDPRSLTTEPVIITSAKVVSGDK
jgi:hypothetical protein